MLGDELSVVVFSSWLWGWSLSSSKKERKKLFAPMSSKIEHQVDLGCERCFPQSFSFIFGISVHACSLFLLPTTAMFCPLQEHHLQFAWAWCVLLDCNWQIHLGEPFAVSITQQMQGFNVLYSFNTDLIILKHF